MNQTEEDKDSINLLEEGPGLRYSLKPENKFGRYAKYVGIILLVAGLFFAWQRFSTGIGLKSTFSGSGGMEEVRVDETAVDKKGFSPSQIKTVKKAPVKVEPEKIGYGSDGMAALDSSGSSEKSAEDDFIEEPVIPNIYYVRYALFLNRENAVKYVEELNGKQVYSEIDETVYPLPYFVIKAGPFPNPNTQKVAHKEMSKFGVVPAPFIEQKYIISDPVWTKVDALAIQKKLLGLGIISELSMEKKPRMVYKVVTGPFDTEFEARAYSTIADERGVKSIVEAVDLVEEEADLASEKGGGKGSGKGKAGGGNGKKGK